MTDDFINSCYRRILHSPTRRLAGPTSTSRDGLDRGALARPRLPQRARHRSLHRQRNGVRPPTMANSIFWSKVSKLSGSSFPKTSSTSTRTSASSSTFHEGIRCSPPSGRPPNSAMSSHFSRPATIKSSHQARLRRLTFSLRPSFARSTLRVGFTNRAIVSPMSKNSCDCMSNWGTFWKR
jgi:hypothetical protein